MGEKKNGIGNAGTADDDKDIPCDIPETESDVKSFSPITTMIMPAVRLGTGSTKFTFLAKVCC